MNNHLKNTYSGSRYLIKYYSNTFRYIFYLSGATHENRQKKFLTLRVFLENLQKENVVDFSVNDNVIQDIKTDALSFKLVEDQHGMIRLIAHPKPAVRSFFMEIFGGEEEIDLGVIPSDKGFNLDVKQFYESLPKSSRESVISLHSMKFNAWDNETTLVGISLKKINNVRHYNYPLNKVSVDIENHDAIVNGKEPKKIIRKIENYMPTIRLEDADEIKRYIMSQFASLSVLEYVLGAV
jgi:hypothetical protein